MKIIVEGEQHSPHMCRNLLWDMEYKRQRSGLPALMVGTVVECDCGVWHVIAAKRPRHFRWHYCGVSRSVMWVQLSERQKMRMTKRLCL